MSLQSTETLAIELIKRTSLELASSPESHRIPTSQTTHRLNLLTAWFGDLTAAKTSLASKTVLEIGCGQGDMTVALAWAVGASGTVHALDPAPLGYGSPETLGEAQARISSSTFGERIKWMQSDPVEAIRADPEMLVGVDFVVMAHSLLYMRSREYVAALFKALREVISTSAVGTQRELKLLIAEWGMRASDQRARAHLFAVQAQAAQPLLSGNVQLYIKPKQIRELALGAGWKEEKEAWIDSPGLDDGEWEVAAARSMPTVSDETPETVRTLLENLESASLMGTVRCMDVWACVLH